MELQGRKNGGSSSCLACSNYVCSTSCFAAAKPRQEDHYAMAYSQHESAGELPPPGTQIWRFMSLTKFLSLVTSSSLYFSRALELRAMDPFEGTLALPNRQHYEILSSGDDDAIREYLKISPGRPLPARNRILFDVGQKVRMSPIYAATVYVNCWHISDEESAFLWRNYSNLEDGVAI